MKREVLMCFKIVWRPIQVVTKKNNQNSDTNIIHEALNEKERYNTKAWI